MTGAVRIEPPETESGARTHRSTDSPFIVGAENRPRQIPSPAQSRRAVPSCPSLTLTVSLPFHGCWQLRMENKIGSLEVGKYADMAIFAKSLRKIAPEHLIEQAKVVGTLLNGKFTYRDGM
jgi:hypothetical protein